MLYVVTGYCRSGTTMMMDALREGGLQAAWDTSRDLLLFTRNKIFNPPFPGTVYELNDDVFDSNDFPKTYDGKLIKVLRKQRVIKMAVMPNDIRIVMMRRHIDEIEASLFSWYHVPIREDVDTDMAYVSDNLQNRRDVVSLHEFWYRDLIDAPLKYFEKLVAAGWPIDPERAASVVDGSKCNFRVEDLVAA